MPSTIAELGPCEREITVTVPEERIKEALDKSFNELRAQVALPGFRPGKVPRGVIERRFGDHVRHEVLHDLMKDSIEAAFTEHLLEAVTEPAIRDHEEGSEAHKLPASGPLTFTFGVEIKPNFELPEYKGIAVQRRIPAVDDAAVDRALVAIAERRASYEPAPDGIFAASDSVGGVLTLRIGDETVIDDRDVTVTEFENQVGEGILLNDVEASFLGKSIDACVEVTATISTEHDHSEWRGMTANGLFKIEEIKRRTVPPIDEALATAAGLESLEALRTDVRSKLNVEFTRGADRKVVEDILDGLVAKAEIPLGKTFIAKTVERRVKELAYRMIQSTGVDVEKAMAAATEHEAEIRVQAEKAHRRWLLIERISKKERIFCLESDVDQAIEHTARAQGLPPSKVREYFENEGMLAEVRAEVVENKTCTFLRESARISDEEPEPPASEGVAAS